MSIELKGVFLADANLFRDLEDPESRKRFKGLMQYQYGFSDKKMDRAIHHLRRQNFLKEKAPEVMVLVTNERSRRAFQIGSLLGYHFGQFFITFPNEGIEIMAEEELAFIEKSTISPEARIGVEFLDEDWENPIRKGKLVGYEKNEDRKEGGAYGLYVVQVDDETQKIKDWGALTTGGFGFFIETGSPSDKNRSPSQTEPNL